MPRTPIPTELKRRVRERDQHRCRKCHRKNGLDIHHIKPVADDGPDNLENLTLLCLICHQEWHLVQHGWRDVVFTEWLELPPFVGVLRWLVSAVADDLSFRDAKTALMQAYHLMRQQYDDDPTFFD